MFGDFFASIKSLAQWNNYVYNCVPFIWLFLLFCVSDRYKEFVKQVGRTVRLVVQYVADHWLNYKSCKERQGDTLSTIPMIEQGPYRYSLDRLQTEFDLFVLRATQWILTAHK